MIISVLYFCIYTYVGIMQNYVLFRCIRRFVRSHTVLNPAPKLPWSAAVCLVRFRRAPPSRGEPPGAPNMYAVPHDSVLTPAVT